MDEEHVFIGVYAPNKIEVNSLVQVFSFSVDAMIGKFFFFLLVHLYMYAAVQYFFLMLFCFRLRNKGM